MAEKDDVPPRRSDPEAEGMPGSGEDVTVVGIGASAGGVQALRAFFEALPTDTGMAFVVIMHLSPVHRSNLVEVLQARTSMPVKQVTETVRFKPNHIYVIPPDKRMEVSDHELSVSEFEDPGERRAPIDLFFRSLAVVTGDGAAIVLSGGGTDGSVGIRDVKEAGGLVLAQDPDEAEHDSMPRSAIATGLVDVVLPVREMAVQLVELKRRWDDLSADVSELTTTDAEYLQRVLAQVRARTGHDFSSYKRSTVIRRVQRRMQVTKTSRIADYLAHLREHPEEAKALFRDLLIGVTSFFRDPDAFEGLLEHVFPALFRDREAGDQIRVWVVGCASGEEAYSIAMLLEEYAETVEIRPKIQIFASDIDEAALAAAREGLYPLGIEADVSQERLERFFIREGSHYRIRRFLRERVLFATHSVTQDTPFSKLDLICCRNLLIYMERELQERVFDLYHYALQPGGYLFLGTSETAESATDRFRVVEKKRRIYHVKERSGEPPRLPELRFPVGDLAKRIGADWTRAKSTGREHELHRQSLEEYAPPSLLVDDGHHILHLSERAGRYLQLPGGTLTGDVTRLVRPELRSEVRTGLYRAIERQTATVARPVLVEFNGHRRTVYVTVHPASDGESGERLALVILDEADEPEVAPEEDEDTEVSDSKVALLEQELRQTQERLQTTNEEFESSREELKSQNEELRSMNEEYKSAMEELETSKEELQSLNEELQTVNSELKDKIDEISRGHDDLQNLIAATGIGTLFLDRELKIKRYTEHAEGHFNIQPSDRGRPISHLTHRFRYDGLEEDARHVLRQLETLEREVEDDRGGWYLIRLRPYRTVEDRIDGVVLTLIEISELKHTQERLRAAKEYAETIVDTVQDGVLILDPSLRVKTASASFCETFGVPREEAEGRRIYDLGDGQWRIPELRQLLEEVLPEKGVLTDSRLTHRFERAGERRMILNARQLDGLDLIFLSIQDITGRNPDEDPPEGGGEPSAEDP
jgi:two-component system, chemotaxis family, CheB/CheR fusion protein